MPLLTVDYNDSYDTPFYSGSAIADATLVPGTFQVAVNGHPYMLDTDPSAMEVYGVRFKEASLPLLRDQSDAGHLPGEQSLSPAQFWRRSQDSWHNGGGQSMLDRDISTPTRFNSSKGINPWTKYQLTLLPGTSNIRSTANTNLVGTTASGNFYVADGTTLAGTANLTGFTTVTGTPAAQAVDMASDGALAYAAFGASGIYTVNGSVATSYVTGTVSHVWFVKNRLLCSNNQNLYNPTAAGALPGTLYAPTTTGLTWVAAAEGDAFIYIASVAGDISRIWRTAVAIDASALVAPVVAATLPKGELVRSLRGYLGYIVIGTDKGVRFATASSTGDLTLGAVIPTPGPVYCLDAYDRFIWFGWSNYDSTSTGIGRFDLQNINDGLAPAYASDLMATGQGTVRGMGQILGRHVFTVDGLGTFAEALTPVTSGSFTTGQINYGIADAKVPIAVDLKHSPLTAGTSVAADMALDRASPAALGSSAAVGSVSPNEPLSTGARRAEEIELTFTLNSSAGLGPTLTRWTLLSYPAPVGASVYTLPLMLSPRMSTFRDTSYHLDPFSEYQFLRSLHDSREIITIQVGADTFEGTMEEYVWLPHALEADYDFWSGTYIATIRRVKG